VRSPGLRPLPLRPLGLRPRLLGLGARVPSLFGRFMRLTSSPLSAVAIKHRRRIRWRRCWRGVVPAGPRDVWVPAYRASPRYVENVNVTNTRVVNVTQVTNVYNTTIVNNNANVTKAN